MTNPLLKEQGLPLFSQIEPEHVEAALDQTLQRNRDELAQILDRWKKWEIGCIGSGHP